MRPPGRREIAVRDGKRGKDRVTLLPDRVAPALAAHLERVRRGAGSVELPLALERKFPKAPWAWAWQWVFPATRPHCDPATGRTRRHHLQRVGAAARGAGGCHPGRRRQARELPHPEALLRHPPAGVRLRHPVQELLGQRDVNPHMIYTHVLNRGG